MTQNRFFTSDQHFGHTNILKYEDEKRRDAFGNKFPSIERMDDFIIDQWNASVAEGDLVYCLGDFCYKLQQMRDVLPFLNGDKVLISGNHDPFFKELTSKKTDLIKTARDKALDAGFIELYLEHEIDIAEIGIVRLHHFPYLPAKTEGLMESELRFLDNRPKVGNESLLLHGHVHSQWQAQQDKDKPLMINVGVEVWGMRPVSEVEIVELFNKTKSFAAKDIAG